MSLSNVNVPSDTSFVTVDSRTDSKVLFLPAASTSNILGRYITFKDFYGTADINNFTISTTGTDRMDVYNSSILVSTSFQSLSLLCYTTSNWAILTDQGATLPSSTPGPSYETTTFDTQATLYSVDVSTSAKLIQLPAISAIPGQTIIIKDAEGCSGANDSSILVSTSGGDLFEYSTTSTFVLSESFGCWTFMNDSGSNWFLTETYLNNVIIQN
jgi:hypothetical protein